jgi:hypothetical protein
VGYDLRASQAVARWLSVPELCNCLASCSVDVVLLLIQCLSILPYILSISDLDCTRYFDRT